MVIDLSAGGQEYIEDCEVCCRPIKIAYGVEDGEALIADFVSYMDKWADLIASVDRTDENALAALAMQEIYDEIDPATYGVYE